MPLQVVDPYSQFYEEDARKHLRDYIQGGKYEPRKPNGLNNYVRIQTVVREMAKRPKGGTLVDLGCAAGLQASTLGKFDERIGVEISETLVEAGKQYHPNVKFILGGLENIPLEDGSASAVTLFEIIEHVPSDEDCLREACRLLKPGGMLYLTTPNLNGDGTTWGRLGRWTGKRRFEPFDPQKIHPALHTGHAHVREYTKSSLRHVMEKVGLEDIRITTVAHWDGPSKVEVLIGRLLHIPFTKKLVIQMERAVDFVAGPLGLGRCLVAWARKPL